MECRLAGETEVLGENLPQRHFHSSKKKPWLDPGLNSGGRGGKPANIIFLFLFYYLVCEAIGIAATSGLLCQPRVIMKMIVEKQMECRLAGETVVSRRKPAPAPLLSITKSHMTRSGFVPGLPWWEASD
jgi:hypothetical protein